MTIQMRSFVLGGGVALAAVSLSYGWTLGPGSVPAVPLIMLFTLFGWALFAGIEE